MKMIFLLASCCTAVAFIACTRNPARSELVAIARDGGQLTSESSEFGTIAQDRWPASIAGLHPEQVYRTPAGLYIATDTFFVEECGLFVPDPAARFVPGHGSDPGYERLDAGVFAYRIKG